jgi:Uma2 family endonuclease
MPATALLTSEQYLSLPEEFDQNGNRIKDELIGGQIVKMPPASLLHDRIKNEIHLILIEYLRAHRDLNLKALVEMGVGIGKYDTFVPDVSVVKRERLATKDRIFRGAPDLAIEVASPTDTAKHLKSKADVYLQGGSQAVWVVFPDARSVTVYSAGSVRELKSDQTIDDPFLPGFSSQVSAFFDLT